MTYRNVKNKKHRILKFFHTRNRNKLACDDDVTHMSSSFLHPTHLSLFYPTISSYRCFTAKMGLGGSWSAPKLCSPEAAAVWGISDRTLAAFCTVGNIY